MDKIKKILLARRAALISKIMATSDDMGQQSVGDVADQAFDCSTTTVSGRILTNDSQELDNIDKALAKIEKGTYGICDDCKNAIPKPRLEVLPFAQYCVRCQEAQESGNS